MKNNQIDDEAENVLIIKVAINMHVRENRERLFHRPDFESIKPPTMLVPATRSMRGVNIMPLTTALMPTTFCKMVAISSVEPKRPMPVVNTVMSETRTILSLNICRGRRGAPVVRSLCTNATRATITTAISDQRLIENSPDLPSCEHA